MLPTTPLHAVIFKKNLPWWEQFYFYFVKLSFLQGWVTWFLSKQHIFFKIIFALKTVCFLLWFLYSVLLKTSVDFFIRNHMCEKGVKNSSSQCQNLPDNLCVFTFIQGIWEAQACSAIRERSKVIIHHESHQVPLSSASSRDLGGFLMMMQTPVFSL